MGDNYTYGRSRVEQVQGDEQLLAMYVRGWCGIYGDNRVLQNELSLLASVLTIKKELLFTPLITWTEQVSRWIFVNKDWP